MNLYRQKQPLQYFDVLNKMSDACISNIKNSGHNEYQVANLLARQLNDDNFKIKEEIFAIGSNPIGTISKRIIYTIDIKTGLIIEVNLSTL